MATFFLIIIYLAFISLGLPDSLLGTAWPVMRQEYDAPLETAGILYMVIAAGTIVSSLASGRIIGKFGTGKVTLISCIMTAGALFGHFLAPSFVWLIICAIPLGLGGGSVDAALNNYVAEHYKAHHMSWLHCFWGVGATLGPVIMAQFVARDKAWRDGYLTVAAIQFALVIILFVTLPLWERARKARQKAPTENEAASEVVPTYTETDAQPVKPLKIKGMKLSLLSFLLYCGIEASVGLWGSSYLVSTKGLQASTAAQWVSLYYGGITAGRFISGFITFKMSNLSLIRAGQATALFGTLLLILPLPAVFSLAGLVIIGLGLAPIYPCMLHETPARFGKHNSQTVMGFQMAVAYTGGTLMPPIFGFIASAFAIGLFPALLLACAAAMLLFTERLNLFFRKKTSEMKTA